MAGVSTPKLDLLRVQETWQFADEAFNKVIDDADNKLVGVGHLESPVHWTAWASSMAYAKNDVVRITDTKTHQYYRCITGGTSGATEPTNNVTGSIVTDGTVKWVVDSLSDGGAVGGGTIAIWLAGKYYTRGDAVLYGGKLYRCTVDHFANNREFELNYWQNISADVVDWQPDLWYKHGDMVVFNHKFYRCITDDTQTFQTWITNADYTVGTKVRYTYNGDTHYFICNHDHTSGTNFLNELEYWDTFNLDDTGNWKLVTDASGVAPWEWGKDYGEGQLISVDGIIFRAKMPVGYIATFQEQYDAGYWELVNSSVRPWQGEIYYPLEVLVEFDGLVYKCITAHTATNDFYADRANWTLFHNPIVPWQVNKYYQQGQIVIYKNCLYRCNTGHDTFVSTTVLYPAPWRTNKVYAVDDSVVFESVLYRCKDAHTSTEFMDDIKKWRAVKDLSVGERTWLPNIQYAQYDTVLYGGMTFECISTHMSASSFLDEDISHWTTTVAALDAFELNQEKWDLIYANIQPWLAGAYYKVGSIVVYNHKLFRCITEHMATEWKTDAANWQNVGGGAGGAVGWETQTSYEVSQLVVHNGVLYRAKENFTSGATFEEDIDKWELVNANIVQWEANKYYPENCLVQYGNLIYKCTTGHISSSVDFETDRSNWILFHVPTAKLEDWQASKYYYAGQCVRYNDSIFICTTNHTSDANQFDTDASNWNILYSSIMYWVADKYYKVGSMVIYNNRIYRCKTAHRANQSVTPQGTDYYFDYQYWTELTAISVRDIPANRYFEANEFGLLDGVIYRANVAHWTPSYDVGATETGYETEFGTIASNWDIVYASIRQYAPLTYYKVGSTVINDNKLYRCNTAHLSTDLGMNIQEVYHETDNAQIFNAPGFTYNSDMGSVKKIKEISFYTEHNNLTGSFAFVNKIEYLVSIDGVNFRKIGQITRSSDSIHYIDFYTNIEARYIRFVCTIDPGTQAYHDVKFGHVIVKADVGYFTLIGAKESVIHEWATNTEYNVNDIVTHNNFIYRCIYGHRSTIFDNDSECWQSMLPNIEDWQPSHPYSVGQYVRYNNKLYRCNTAHTSTTSITPDIAKWNMVSGNLSYWQASTPYNVDDIFVYDGQIYRVQMNYTSGATFENTRLLEPFIPEEWQANTVYTTGEIFEESGVLYKVVNDFTSGATFSVTTDIEVVTPVTFAEGTSVSIDDIVEDNGNYYIATANFVCGDTLIETILEEYVPKHVTKSDIQDIIDAFNLSGGGGSSVNSVPIGTIISFMGLTAPDEYLICDGTVYNIDEYKELADFINNQFGSYNNFGGNGITTFAVPDLRGEFLRGSGTNGHTNQGSGASVGEHQDGTRHVGLYGWQNSSIAINVKDQSTIGNNVYYANVDSGEARVGGLVAQASPFTAASTIDYSNYTSRPTNTSVLYCIKYKS